MKNSFFSDKLFFLKKLLSTLYEIQLKTPIVKRFLYYEFINSTRAKKEIFKIYKTPCPLLSLCHYLRQDREL